MCARLADPRHGSLVLSGTTRHYDDPNRPTRVGEGATTLKTTEDGIILVPQPSDDPNDPLNWPLWKRDLITAILSMTAM